MRLGTAMTQAYFRALLWIIIGAKLAISGDWFYALWIICLGTTSCFVPIAQKHDNERYVR